MQTAMEQCDECQASFASAKELREHVAQHKWGPHETRVDASGRAVFRCLFEGCGKEVGDRKVLRKHLLTHRPREFACLVAGCGKRFYERAKLKRHSLVHSGEKKFQCGVAGCGKRFAYKANLKTHLRTHSGHRPFPCPHDGCSKSFAQASNRNAHLHTHTAQTLTGSPRSAASSAASLPSSPALQYLIASPPNGAPPAKRPRTNDGTPSPLDARLAWLAQWQRAPSLGLESQSRLPPTPLTGKGQLGGARCISPQHRDAPLLALAEACAPQLLQQQQQQVLADRLAALLAHSSPTWKPSGGSLQQGPRIAWRSEALAPIVFPATREAEERAAQLRGAEASAFLQSLLQDARARGASLAYL